MKPIAFGGFSDFSGFMPRYRAVMASIVSPEQIVRICQELIEDEAAQGVAYTQVMVSPHRYDGRFGPVDELFDLMCSGFDKGVAAVGGGIEWSTHINADRTMGSAWAEDVATWAASKAGTGKVRAWGIASDEQQGPPEVFTRAAAIAREAGLLVVPHAGEIMGPDSVRGALDHLGAVGIAHGVRAVEDPELVLRLAGEGIPLHVCPTSNHCLSVVPSFAAHPLPSLMEAGVRVTLNADDQLFFASPVAEEYDKVRTTFGASDAELAAIARTSAQVSGAPRATVAAILAGIDEWLAT